MLARLECPQMGHLPVGGALNDCGVVLEWGDAQQPVVMRGLLVGRNCQPLVIRVELARHGCLGSLE